MKIKQRFVMRPAIYPLSVFVLFYVLLTGAYAQEAVSFQTQDGWTLSGVLYQPETVRNKPLPAVILVTEPGVLDRTIYDTYLSQDLVEAGFAVLNFDLRGTGESLGSKPFEEFTDDDMDGLQLDIRAAVDFMATQSTVDPARIGVVGSGISSKYVVLETAYSHPMIQSIVLLSGELDDKAEEYLKFDHSVPVLTVVDKNEKENFRAMARAHALSTHSDSDFVLARGHGTVMFSYTRGLEEKVVHWLEHNLKALGTEKLVSFDSEDDWKLHGTLRMPEDSGPENRVPAVVMVHGAKHDQQTYYFLARVLAKHGMASLRFDWRGKGKSKDRDRTEDRDLVYRDVEAAIDFIAAQPSVDSQRIGAIAATWATVHTLQASLDDNRVRTVVLLTALAPDAGLKQLLSSSAMPIFGIASRSDYNYMRGSLAEPTRQIYQLSNSKESEFLLYDDAGRGSEMLKIQPELQPMVIRWFKDKLQGIAPTELHQHNDL